MEIKKTTLTFHAPEELIDITKEIIKQYNRESFKSLNMTTLLVNLLIKYKEENEQKLKK